MNLPLWLKYDEQNQNKSRQISIIQKHILDEIAYIDNEIATRKVKQGILPEKSEAYSHYQNAMNIFYLNMGDKEKPMVDEDLLNLRGSENANKTRKTLFFRHFCDPRFARDQLFEFDVMTFKNQMSLENAEFERYLKEMHKKILSPDK